MKPAIPTSCLTVFALLVAGGASYAEADGDWPTFRHDQARTGRSNAVGHIAQPVVLWRYQVAPICSLIELTPADTGTTLTLDERKPVAPDYWSAAAPDWNQDQRRVDLAGDGKLTVVTESRNIRYGRFLPGAKGVQKLYFEDGMAVKARPDGPRKPVARGMLYRYDRGKEEFVWRTEPEEQAEIPLCALADMNGDGRDDLAVSTWWRVMVFDTATGKKTMECRWHKGRNYGHFQLANLDDDPYPECIVFADFMIHLNVLDNDGKRLSLAWRKEVEFTLFGKRKTLRVPYEPVVRCGDGKKLLVVNLFNDGGDERWHVTAFEPMTGKVVVDLPDRYLHGLADLDGDGADEMLLSETKGRAIPRAGRLYFGTHLSGDVKVLPLPGARGRWMTYEGPLRRDRATCAAEGRRLPVVTDFDNDGRKEAWATGIDPATGRRAVGAITREGLLDLPCPAGHSIHSCPQDAALRIVAVRDDTADRPAGILLQVDCLPIKPCASSLPPFETTKLSAELRSRHIAPTKPDVPVVARLKPDQPPTIVVAGGSRHLLGLRIDGDTQGQPKEILRTPGRSQTDDAATFWGPELADVDGDGAREILAAESTADGLPALVARTADRDVLWRRAFERFAAGPSVWNTSGILTWTTGRFRERDKIDVVVTLRRSVMHTDETYLLDGKTGAVVWHQDDAEKRGWGGKPFAIGDCNADGLDEIVCQYPDIHFVADGRSGKLLRFATWPHSRLGGWSAYGYPILVRPHASNAPAVLTGNCRYTVALWSLPGKLIWHTPYLDGLAAHPAVADFDGDSRDELLGPAYRGGLRCYDVTTGKLEAEDAAIKGAVSSVAAGDVSGDGRIEAVVAVGTQLRALTIVDGKLAEVWRIDVGARAFDPVLADVDGDGSLEVLALTSDGRVVCVGAR